MPDTQQLVQLHDLEQAVVIGLQMIFDAHLRDNLLIVPITLARNVDAGEEIAWSIARVSTYDQSNQQGHLKGQKRLGKLLTEQPLEHDPVIAHNLRNIEITQGAE